MLARLPAQHRDQLLDRAEAAGRRHDDHGDRREVADRFKALDRVVGQLFVERRHNAHDGCADQQRVAVGLRIGHDLRRDVARHARLVVDQHLLAEDFREPLRQQTSRNVGRPTRRKADHQPDRPVWIGALGPCHGSRCREYHAGRH